MKTRVERECERRVMREKGIGKREIWSVTVERVREELRRRSGMDSNNYGYTGLKWKIVNEKDNF